MHEDGPSGHDEPLPATLGFVFAIGAFIAIGWGLMFWLLASRWS